MQRWLLSRCRGRLSGGARSGAGALPPPDQALGSPRHGGASAVVTALGDARRGAGGLASVSPELSAAMGQPEGSRPSLQRWAGCAAISPYAGGDYGAVLPAAGGQGAPKVRGSPACSP